MRLKLKQRTILASVALTMCTLPAFADDCDKGFRDLTKAISETTTLPSGHQAAMVRRVLGAYDICMAGDKKHLNGIRDEIMLQIKENLGGTR